MTLFFSFHPVPHLLNQRQWTNKEPNKDLIDEPISPYINPIWRVVKYKRQKAVYSFQNTLTCHIQRVTGQWDVQFFWPTVKDWQARNLHGLRENQEVNVWLYIYLDPVLCPIALSASSHNPTISDCKVDLLALSVWWFKMQGCEIYKRITLHVTYGFYQSRAWCKSHFA